MTMVSRQQLWFSTLALALTVRAATAQTVLPVYGPGLTVQSLVSPSTTFASLNLEPPAGDNAQLLLDFKDSDIKFNLQSLMEILRDHKHEGWVLAAYPDPNTNRPLIGAGFSLDVEATPHPQRDPLNPHPFVEPSSAELWQAAGLPPDRLQQILADFERDQARWSKKTYRHKVLRQKLAQQLTDEEATSLLRISAIQAVENARAYCRGFDQLSGSQQMALSQLVFQMGVNLQQFVEFLGALNDPAGARELAQLDGYPPETEEEHWRTVQTTLMDSQWARRYSIRAASVIAMFDPHYGEQPQLAEERIAGVLRPAVPTNLNRRRNHPAATLRAASYHKHPGKSRNKKVHQTPA